MKNTGKCPKCGGTELAHIDGPKSPIAKIKTGVTSSAGISYYVCLACGFCEQWVDSRIDLGDLRRMFPPKPHTP